MAGGAAGGPVLAGYITLAIVIAWLRVRRWRPTCKQPCYVALVETREPWDSLGV